MGKRLKNYGDIVKHLRVLPDTFECALTSITLMDFNIIS